jgi:hypothetical protein
MCIFGIFFVLVIVRFLFRTETSCLLVFAQPIDFWLLDPSIRATRSGGNSQDASIRFFLVEPENNEYLMQNIEYSLHPMKSQLKWMHSCTG